ncbi:LytTR family DNA-binding domain-containing protein [Roseivirga sp. E12]|uniref:LytR/AlgR family response regulator transcription factor n=1 Tax=Roseivirga sp. E12 TaxID=2819237 RepID=UPI001ABC588D|nr:response regulator [Roseivirga sp. E12]MBO3697334.1 response regulator [Roseivirga sp. E12]
MTKIRILVAEDNPIHATRMDMLLDEMGYENVGIYAKSDEFLRTFHAVKPDLVLLDIELEGNKDGVEIAAKITASSPVPVIFTSALEDKKTLERAQVTNPYAYLVKPVEKGSLQASIELAVYKFAKDQEKDELNEPFGGWKEDLLVTDGFFVKAGSKLEKVHYADVLWIEVAQERYCDIVTSSRNYHLRTSIASLAEKLAPSAFVRIHRRYIVNASKIDSIDESDLTIEVGEHTLSMGKTYKTHLIKRLQMLH